ncbi:MAG: sigma-70 family RNA polymerase sigma factor [Gemmatimonadota bacterium]
MPDIERLFTTYHAALVRYLTRRLGDRDWADEIAQETFVRALRQGHLENERAWLFAVASNLVRDEARKDIRRRRHLELLAAEWEDAHVEAPDVTLERALDAADARRALDALAERDRQALLLRGEGLDYPEIAEILGIAASSVGTTLSRARKRLAETYEAQVAQRAHRGNHAAS